VTGIVSQRSERDLSHAAATAAGHGRRRSRRRFEATLREIRGVGKARGVTHDHAYAGAAIVSGTQLLYSSLVQHGRRSRAILDEDFGEFSAAGHGFAQRARQNIVFNQGVIHARERTRVDGGRYLTRGRPR